MSILERIESLKKKIPKETKIIAASKYVGYEEIREAYESGLRDFAESRVQDGISKISNLNDLYDISWHFIGHLQSNKVRSVLKVFDYIHSIDSFDLLKRVDYIAGDLGVKTKVLLQVKLADDKNKFGFDIEELQNSILKVKEIENIQVEGLMTMLPYGLKKEENLNLFLQLKMLRDELEQTLSPLSLRNIKMRELSMGMSSDFMEAIEAGSTMIRLGRAIFT